eukprot:TRINITY_DN3468_c0_g1_i1.p1 TRINITY_DN3468_c0_g1~~TRINITY_DN3468_c0_g1_i1.p1  ORF type:complete len:371 (-),score=92.77 TRINITY_DN3468_c0_g1_i1:526-1638(-)
MKLTFKTLKQETFDIQAEPTETVAQIKKNVENLKGAAEYLADWQKLIYAGKVLDDSQTIGSYNIKETDFLVIMVKKTAAKPAAAAPTPAPTPAPAPAAVAAPEAPKPAEAAAPTPVAEAPAASGASPASAASTLVTGSAFETAVAQLEEMGFPKDQVLRAMRASFNNPDRAVEYLMNGIPDLPEERVAPPPAAAAGPTAPSGPGSAAPINLFAPQAAQSQGGASAQGGAGGDVFGFLRQHPQFNLLRQLVQQNPAMLQPVLQQLGQSNPQILHLIQQHQQEFIQLLNEPIPQGQGAPDLAAALGGQLGGGGAGGPPGAQYIQVTTEEKAAIDRLEQLGFERQLVIEAFFACDKDENLTANYLLEHQFDQE